MSIPNCSIEELSGSSDPNEAVEVQLSLDTSLLQIFVWFLCSNTQVASCLVCRCSLCLLLLSLVCPEIAHCLHLVLCGSVGKPRDCQLGASGSHLRLRLVSIPSAFSGVLRLCGDLFLLPRSIEVPLSNLHVLLH